MSAINSIYRYIHHQGGIFDKKLRFYLTNKNVSELGVTTQKRSTPLIISLTSYPARIPNLHYTIATLLKQSIKPDMLILWLGEEQFPNKENDLPKQLLDLQEYGLTISWTKDIKSFKKLLPTMQLYPESIIVTADDDFIFWHTWLEELYDCYNKNGKEKLIYCHRYNRIILDDDGHLTPYKTWIVTKHKQDKSYFNFSTGGAGSLYPPHCLYKDTPNEELFMELCPKADDVWFWAMAVMNHTKTMCCDKKLRKIYYPNIKSTQEYALNNVNNAEISLNDIQIKKVIEHYPEIMNILREENKR